MRKIIYLLMVFVLLVSMSCSKKPANIKFIEYVGKEYSVPDDATTIEHKRVTDPNFNSKKNFHYVDSSFVKFLIFETHLAKVIGTTKIKIQLIGKDMGDVVDEQEAPVNPEMKGLASWYQFPRSGKFSMLILKGDDIIAKGDIEIK